jgi:CubicO group peptidase (beta-lactamase class C family)
MPNRIPLAVIAALILNVSVGSVSYASALTLEERIDRYIASYPKHLEFHGVILVALGDKILLHKGYGLASREFGVSNGPDAKFQVGSITKAFTSILALKLAEQGILKLDAAISDYLPDYPAETGKKITIRQLLSHTSGILHHIDALPNYWISHDKVFHTPRELRQLFAKIPLAHEPGRRFTYSSPGFYILGAILQHAAKKSYSELLREDIFEPLGMKDTRIENNRTVQPGMATGYMRGLTGLIRAGFEDKSTALAAGDLVTSARDLYLWDRGLKAEPNKLLSPESKKLLYAPILPGQIMSMGGPVLQIPYEDGRKTISINRLSGSSTGYVAAMDRFFEIDGCVVVLSNVEDAPTDIILDHVGDFLLRRELGIPIGVPAPETMTPPPPAAVSKMSIDKILGFYQDTEGTLFGVIQDGGKLYYMAYVGGRIMPPVQELVARSEDTFQFGNRPGFECRTALDPKNGRRTLVTLRNGRALASAEALDPQNRDTSEYAGFFTSVELQKTFRLSPGPEGLVAEKFLGDGDLLFILLEKDLFGFGRGFVKFDRDSDGAVSGFRLMTKDVDTYFGSKFIKISSEK